MCVSFKGIHMLNNFSLHFNRWVLVVCLKVRFGHFVFLLLFMIVNSIYPSPLKRNIVHKWLNHPSLWPVCLHCFYLLLEFILGHNSKRLILVLILSSADAHSSVIKWISDVVSFDRVKIKDLVFSFFDFMSLRLVEPGVWKSTCKDNSVRDKDRNLISDLKRSLHMDHIKYEIFISVDVHFIYPE